MSKGGHVLLGGRRHALGQTFFEPTVLADVTPQMKVVGANFDRSHLCRNLVPEFRINEDFNVEF